MRSSLARTLLIFTALWLPLQALAGMTMKLAGDAAPMPQAVENACPYHHAAAAPATPEPSQRQLCDNCGVCHLATAGYLPAAAAVAAMLPAARSFALASAVEQQSHISEPPQYPPKRSA